MTTGTVSHAHALKGPKGRPSPRRGLEGRRAPYGYDRTGHGRWHVGRSAGRTRLAVISPRPRYFLRGFGRYPGPRGPSRQGAAGGFACFGTDRDEVTTRLSTS